MSATTYFVSGGNRGIGFEFVAQLATRANSRVIATAREPEKAIELQALKKKLGNIEIVKLDVASESSLEALKKELPTLAPEGIDVFISNAGIGSGFGTVLNTTRKIVQDHLNTNFLGGLFLFQAVYPYLKKKQTKKAIFISTMAGSIGAYIKFPVAAYGSSKVALKYIVHEAAFELADENFTLLAIHPGMVSTDMSKSALELVSPQTRETMKQHFITPEQSVKQQLEVIDKLTTADSGSFVSYDGSSIPW